ncbi:hypothetical protein MBLNU230_g3526t1 [Neophaeotheca triangularis]
MAGGVDMNVFRILADVSHTTSKLILIWAIHSNRSAEGVSLLTQLLYILVFCTRYLDIFVTAPHISYWNFVLKIFYPVSSAYIVYLMMRVYARTRERERAWKLAMWCLGGSLGTAVGVFAFESVVGKWNVGFWHFRPSFLELCWIFSIILESVCVLPQLLLLRQTSVPTVLDSFYLVTLGSYRFFYIVNWIWRSATGGWVSPVSVIFGIIQTLFYIDFAWVYWTRQRVKLRGGGVVDGDDLSKSYLVRRFIGRRGGSQGEDGDGADEEEEEEGLESGVLRHERNWGARGISVSADDTLVEHQGHADRDAQMVDPAHFEDEDEDGGSKAPRNDGAAKRGQANGAVEGTVVGSSAEEWQENTGTFGR